MKMTDDEIRRKMIAAGVLGGGCLLVVSMIVIGVLAMMFRGGSFFGG